MHGDSDQTQCAIIGITLLTYFNFNHIKLYNICTFSTFLKLWLSLRINSQNDPFNH